MTEHRDDLPPFDDEALARLEDLLRGTRGRDGAPERIGPYRLLKQVGEGSFGTVWLAERRDPFVQRVALKLIKLNRVSERVLARFEEERQTLARMDHPGIAKVLDGGVADDGRPYFTMEFVKGEPITEYCDRRRLGIRERLELFAQVCEAVQHAHTKRVVHRDLKPSNILVMEAAGSVGQVKIIDFGFAKELDYTQSERAFFTEEGIMVGTPEYMSPEQADPGVADVDARSDVYSLGVVLYQLVSGHLPFDPKMLRAKAYAEVQRVIREDDPPSPSAQLAQIGTKSVERAREIERARGVGVGDLARQLRQELEWIPLMAIRKDPYRRYQTAQDMLRDVRNYLEGKPLLVAAPERASYRVWKFVARYRGVVAAVLAIALTLAAATVVSGGFAVVAATQRAEADRARERSDANLYASNIEMGQAWLSLDRIDRVGQRLEECPSDRRGWEWHWLAAEMDSSIAVIEQPSGRSRFGTYSPDGTRIVSAGLGRGIGIWDASTTRLLAYLEVERTEGMAWFPNGERILLASEQDLAIVDLKEAREIRRIASPDRGIASINISMDGGRIAIGEQGGAVSVVDAADGSMLRSIEISDGEPVERVMFSVDGSKVAARLGQWEWTVIDLDSGSRSVGEPRTDWTAAPEGCAFVPRAIRVGESRDFVDFSWSGPIRRLSEDVFSRDGRWKARKDLREVEIENRHSGAQVVLKGHAAMVWSVEFSADGLLAVTASVDGTARVWDVRTGVELAKLVGHVGEVEHAIFSPDARRVLTFGATDGARVWEAPARPETAELDRVPADSISRAQFSPDGRYLLVEDHEDDEQGKSPVSLCDARTGDLIARWGWDERGLFGAAFDAAGARFAVHESAGAIGVFTCADGVRHGSIETASLFGEGEERGIDCLALHPIRAVVAVAFHDGSLRLFDCGGGGGRLELEGVVGRVHGLAFGAGGSRLAVALASGKSLVLDTETGNEVFEVDEGAVVLDIAFHPQGANFAAVLADGRVRIRDAASGSLLRECFDPRLGTLRDAVQLTYAEGGSRIVLTRAEEGDVVAWEAATGALVQCTVSRFCIGALHAVSPDGSKALRDFGSKQAFVVPEWMADVNQNGRRPAAVFEDSWCQGTVVSPRGSEYLGLTARRGLEVRDFVSGRRRMRLGSGDDIGCADWSGDGRRIVTGEGAADGVRRGRVRVWETTSGATLVDVRCGQSCPLDVRFSPDGRRIGCLFWNGSAVVLDADTGAVLAELVQEEDEGFSSVAFTPDGETLVIGTEDGRILVWDPDAPRNVRSIRLQAEPINALALDPEGERVAAALEDGSVLILQLGSGRELMRLDVRPAAAASVRFDGDGSRLLVGSSDGIVRLYETEGGRQLLIFEQGEAVRASACFTESGSSLVAFLSETGPTVLDIVPERVRFAERQLRASGVEVDLGREFMDELAGRRPATWLTDPSQSERRPDFMR